MNRKQDELLLEAVKHFRAALDEGIDQDFILEVVADPSANATAKYDAALREIDEIQVRDERTGNLLQEETDKSKQAALARLGPRTPISQREVLTRLGIPKEKIDKIEANNWKIDWTTV